MIINTAGDYTLRYTATDECGNSSSVDRSLVVEAPPTYRTVLYTDGTFIINESSRDQAANEALHGVATNVYDSLGESNYVFSNESYRPWHAQVSLIKRVQIGSSIIPTSTRYWFRGCVNLELVDFSSNIDFSRVTNTSNMFSNCVNLTVLDLSTINTARVLEMNSMFYSCGKLQTIYASSMFDVTNVSSSSDMFGYCSNLVGGAGTTYSASNPKDKTYAHIDGGTSDPGYFTAKPSA